MDNLNSHLPPLFEDFPKIKVLVIEDEPIAAKMARIVLEEKGCAIEVVSTGEAAIKSINESYHLILLDLSLPGMDGFEAAKIMRKSMGLNTPIVALTSDRSDQTIELAQQLGLNGYMYKPITSRKCHLLLVKFIFSKWDLNYFYFFEDEKVSNFE